MNTTLRQKRIETIIKFFNQSKVAKLNKKEFMNKMSGILRCDIRAVREIITMLEETHQIEDNKWS